MVKTIAYVLIIPSVFLCGWGLGNYLYDRQKDSLLHPPQHEDKEVIVYNVADDSNDKCDWLGVCE